MGHCQADKGNRSRKGCYRAMLVMSAVLFAAARVKNVVTLLIVGLMAGYLCSAATSVLSAFAQREQIANYAATPPSEPRSRRPRPSMRRMGSFAGFTWPQVGILYAIVLATLLLSCLLAKPLNALSMGDRYAESMGIRVKPVRFATNRDEPEDTPST